MKLQIRGKEIGSLQNDRTVAVENLASAVVGRLKVAVIEPEIEGESGPLPAGGAWLQIATSGVLLRLEAYNPTAGALNVSFGLRGSAGTPDRGHALLAWNTAIAAGASWRWEGEILLEGYILYAKSSAVGIVVYHETEMPAP